LAELRAKQAEDEAKNKRIQDLELALADQITANAELQMRTQDIELAIADQLTGGEA
jgi:hypothetical protein